LQNITNASNTSSLLA